MGRWTAETHGVDVLRVAARKLLSHPGIKPRVWSDTLCAWGFYDKTVTEDDEFLFWTMIDVGDRICLSTIENHDIATVVKVFQDKEKATRNLLLLLSSGRVVTTSIEEGKLFRCGRKHVFTL
jgi:hypothetical protein